MFYSAFADSCLARTLVTSTIAAVAAAVFVATGALPPARAAPAPEDVTGQIRAEVDGQTLQFPSLKTDISADIQGDLAAVTVVQTFVNPATVPLNATYLFPLGEDAAVHAMQMKVGDEIIEARIARKPEARQTFEAAKREGKSAALLEQHRPNMFTQNVANLMPGMPIEVTLRYVQTVPRIDGAYELVLPLIVGPRYMPPAHGLAFARAAPGDSNKGDGLVPDRHAPHEPQRNGEPTAAPLGQWTFAPPPAYPPVNGLTAPQTIDEDRVSIAVTLAAGSNISNVASTSHAITVDGDAGSNRRRIALANGRTIDNRDFILHYTLAGDAVHAGLLSHAGENGGTFSLLIEPPAAPNADKVTPREIVFVLDTSGSMGGAPLDAAKAFMTQALRVLRPTDYFRLIRFSSSASELASGPIAASAGNIQRAMAFVSGLTADGGTEVLSGLQKAFDIQPMPGTHRMIVFLSDGYVGNEAEILRMVADNIGTAHTYVLGVGTGVNRYLLAEMAHQGRGFLRVVDPTETGEAVATAFAKRLDTTVMTDLSIDWGTLGVADVTPAALPDLFAGDSLRVQGRFSGGGTHIVTVKGKVNGQSAQMPLEITLPDGPTGSETRAIPLVWARSQIKDHMRELMTPARLRRGGRTDGQIEEAVTSLGLSHHLMTQWTSFVAVTTKVLNPEPSSARESEVNLPMVKGVGPGAYPDAAGPGGRNGVRGFTPPLSPQPTPGPVQQRASNPFYQTVVAMQPTFGGTATPEPEAIGGLGVMLLGVWLALARRRRAAAN
ncbi:MAG: VWA domain-containing protein [Hyphomicrobiaceae bacterium]|nr:VWA domain-containing protein [Hyphomicrobiaceae bacterium]MCC0008039.1 VWA domain-containing protein [Hyphomicrobiaceae bacterium]